MAVKYCHREENNHYCKNQYSLNISSKAHILYLNSFLKPFFFLIFDVSEYYSFFLQCDQTVHKILFPVLGKLAFKSNLLKYVIVHLKVMLY